MDWQDDTIPELDARSRRQHVEQTTRTEVDLEPWGDLTAPPFVSDDWDVPTLITHAPRPRRGTG